VALFGLPGVLAPMRVLTDPVEYIDHDAALYRDVRRLETSIPGMSMTDVWIQGSPGSASGSQQSRLVYSFLEGFL
jgi:hypothetical protein